ncbi:protein FAM177B isoform A [Alligator mississippiensis]|uniref:Protein FAM177B isoform A n=1 Tax=Alligator mississippiensis TaxID=8496 RepID=A0A151P468_ALLMI|nr:protein FAM177B isoform A [Alligator mississippiensis]
MENDRCSKGEDSMSQHNENNIVRGERKSPRRIIYFANGDTMEEYNTEEEEEEEEHQTLDTSKFSWGLYLWFWAVRIASMSFFTCEFLGGKLATLFGLNEPKYQYAIDEYYRTQSKESEDDEDGEEIFEKNEVNSLNEKCHLELQSIGYGSVGLKDPAEFSQRGAWSAYVKQLVLYSILAESTDRWSLGCCPAKENLLKNNLSTTLRG